MKARHLVIAAASALLTFATLTALPRAARAQATEPRECAMARQERARGRTAFADLLDRRCATRLAQMARAAQAMPSGPAGAPGAGAGAVPSGRADWGSELPTVAAVQQAIAGASPSETQARQEAAFAVLSNYIEQRNGNMFKALAPMVATRLQEYRREQSREHPMEPRSVSPAADKYYEDPDFRDETLAKFLSPGSVAAYDATSDMHDLRDSRHPVVQTPADDAAARNLLAPALALAHKSGTDLTVFGVTLGGPLNLPACAGEEQAVPIAGVPGAQPEEQTCRVVARGGLFGTAFAQTLITGTLGPEAPGVVNVTVRVAPSRCAQWASCELVVGTWNGYALAVSLLTTYGADKQDQVEALLAAKYHHPPTSKDTFSECKQSYRGLQLGAVDRAAVRIWALPGLDVAYVPYGTVAGCANGGIRVQLHAFTDLVERSKQEHLDAQPKM